ncbi:MAG TPA: malto-oligosyltrehalose trehalohydrolase, partial [Terriglobales bacterium]
MKRSHKMPFGAECRADGSVRFRLWAPGASAVDLVLVDADAGAQAMTRLHAGWFQLVTNSAKPGSRYFFQVNGDTLVPDPASRFQPQDVHGPSEVVDPESFAWTETNWNGRTWEEAIIYELHVGTFTPSGKFTGLIEHLDYLVDLGITAIEVMPVAGFPGKRNWGYDGVFPYAPDSSYGTPQDLKTLVEAAHAKGLMIFLDVVYNHFGPEGNYLRVYAPQFFTGRHKTPWGDGINFDGPESRVVRDFFIHNALYWLVEYNFDGLRFDAVHAIQDDSSPDILEEVAATVHQAIDAGRHIHLVLENDRNEARYLRSHGIDAQWNDDIHHALHVLATGEADGYYRDYSDYPAQHLGRCLTQGFAYQGEPSAYHGGVSRGEKSDDLPPTAFVSFVQNHDQVGNRAFGERITALAEPAPARAAISIFLLAPQPPLLFMGEEFAAGTPFLFFCDFGKELAQAVTEGRRNEFARFQQFQDPAVRAKLPDPGDVITFERSALDWQSATEPCHRDWLNLYRNLLRLRRDKIVPLLR